MEKIINIEEYKKKKFTKWWNNVTEHISSYDLPIPSNSKCVNMTKINNKLIAVFDIPERVLVTFKIDPDKKLCEEIKL